MKPRFTILGGSTPFTAGLVNSIETRGFGIPAHELVLVGRNRSNLEIIARYARNRLSKLDWVIDTCTDLREALQGAHIVLHQVRYGGLKGRAADEHLALTMGLLPDETLGPAALQSCLRLAPKLDEYSRLLAQLCPKAWVLNLTNPLSVTTARMIHAGVRRCVGLCELPRVTAERAAALIMCDLRYVTWSYIGLNHRGFIVRFDHNGIDQIDNVARCLGAETLFGVNADEITALHALPTKYFCLMRSNIDPPKKGRAAFLEGLRRQIVSELRDDPTSSPPSLAKRYMAWYELSVVPFIRAIYSEKTTLLEVNVLTERNIVEEVRAFVGESGLEPLVYQSGSYQVKHWVARYRDHERLLLEAVDRPGFHTIRRALQSDPLVPDIKVTKCAQRICENLGLSGSTT